MSEIQHLAQASTTTKEPVINHTTNKPWRDGALGYENVEMTGDDGKRHLHCAEEAVWAAFAGEWPQPGYRVVFKDGNPANRNFDNLELLTPEQAKQLDAQTPKSRFAKQNELSSFIREMMARIHKNTKKTPPLHSRVEGANGHYFELVSEDGQRSHTVSASGGPLTFPIRLTVVNGEGEEFSFETNSKDGNGIRHPLY